MFICAGKTRMANLFLWIAHSAFSFGKVVVSCIFIEMLNLTKVMNLAYIGCCITNDKVWIRKVLQQGVLVFGDILLLLLVEMSKGEGWVLWCHWLIQIVIWDEACVPVVLLLLI